jgi:hypothetical protein
MDNMDLEALKKQSREVQIVLGGTVLYIIFSFFDWQQVSFLGQTAGFSEWRGFGVVTVLVAIVLLVWEIGRLVDFKIGLGSLTPGQVSAGLALILLVFTVITFVTHNEARHWPAWVGLLLSLVIAGAAFVRAKAEGVTMPDMPKNISIGQSSSSSSSSSPSSPPSAGAATTEPAPPPAPPAPESPEA